MGLTTKFETKSLFGGGDYANTKYLGTYLSTDIHVFDGYTFNNPLFKGEDDTIFNKEGFIINDNDCNALDVIAADQTGTESEPIIRLEECCFMNAWDPLSNGGNGNYGDKSLDGYIGSVTDIAFRCNPSLYPDESIHYVDYPQSK